MKERLENARRVVVKIGSNLLVGDSNGKIGRGWLGLLADDIADLRRRGVDVVIVTSGAIAVGRRKLKLNSGNLRLEESQAAAAAGQVQLALAYQEVLGRHDIEVAQILLTLDDTENRRRYLNALNTVNTLLRLGVIPLVNENDTVATDMIRIGDNDRLAARVAMMASADVLILLSDVQGLFDRDPRHHPDARLIPCVDAITQEIEDMAGQIPSGDSSGGIQTKLEAARIAMQAGCHMVIADGRNGHALRDVADGKPCTWFVAQDNPSTARRRWIAGTLRPSGIVTVDSGAAKALSNGRSLLPAGVMRVEGGFEKGDAVVVTGPDGQELARGLVGYSFDDANRIAGHRSGEIECLLGYPGRHELIHRDDLVMS